MKRIAHVSPMPSSDATVELRRAKRRCAKLSKDLVPTWNRITRSNLERTRQQLDPQRHGALTARLHELHIEQDQLEDAMTHAAEKLARLLTPTKDPMKPPRPRIERQPDLFEVA
jgi:hypothetical protein